ncbi:MAG: hypothetical protein V7746_01080 [Halioglobus sp.]
MSIGSWDPAAEAASQHINIDAATLARFIALSKNAQLDHLSEHLAGDESQTLSGLMQLESAPWLEAAEDLSSEEVEHLIRFFAVAENLPGWEAGEKSPVIPLAKILRKRGAKLDKSLLQWLRTVNDNRYLPYGPL